MCLQSNIVVGLAPGAMWETMQLYAYIKSDGRVCKVLT